MKGGVELHEDLRLRYRIFGAQRGGLGGTRSAKRIYPQVKSKLKGGHWAAVGTPL